MLSSLFKCDVQISYFQLIPHWIKAGTISGRGISEKHQKRMNPIKTEPMTQSGPYLRNRARTFPADESTFTSNSHLSLLMQCRFPTPKGTIIGLGHSGLKINPINMWNKPPIFSLWFRLSTITPLFYTAVLSECREAKLHLHNNMQGHQVGNNCGRLSKCAVNPLCDIYIITKSHHSPTEILTTVDHWW